MTAFFGALGFELDPTKLTTEEKAEIKNYVSFYKKHRLLFQRGRFFRLLSPASRTYSAWQVLSDDGKEAILGFYRLLAQPAGPPQRVLLRGLAPRSLYAVSAWEDGGCEEEDRLFNCGLRAGDELMHGGLLLDALTTGNRSGDFHAELFHIHAV
jgi:alpha-galactosidase